MFPIEIYINKIVNTVYINKTNLSGFLLFLLYSSPYEVNPDSSINLFNLLTSKRFSSYSILTVAKTKLTLALKIPSCLFKYFSSPAEQPLHVIPPTFKIIFFILPTFLYINKFIILI